MKYGFILLLTVISFLLIVIEGEKIAGFMFMYFLLLPFAVIDGSSNVFSLKFDIGYIMIIDIIVLIVLYLSVFLLFRAFYYKLNTRKSNLISFCSILILQIQALQFKPNAEFDFFSWTIFYGFLIISILNMGVLLANFKANNNSKSD
jgi:hypothetical protein